MPLRPISVYVDYRLDSGTPFYVGKGVPNRVKSFKRNQVHARIVARHGVRREVVFQTLSNEAAMEFEAQLIRELKTRDTFGGANLTDGGEGTAGWTPSEETRQRMSESWKDRVVSKETCQRMSQTHKRRYSDPCEHEKTSAAMRRMWSDPEFHERVAKTRVGEGNSQNKITAVDVLEIRRQYDSLDLSVRGTSSRFLHEKASHYSVTPQNIWGIVRRKSWTHLP